MRRLAVIVSSLILLALPSVAHSWTLVTPEEDARDSAAPHFVRTGLACSHVQAMRDEIWH
jgi:hypothetical protein